MALKVWMPLNGNIKNLGTAGNNLIINTAVTYVDLGKTSLKAFSGGQIAIPASITNSILNNNTFSYTCWIYVNAPAGSSGAPYQNIFFGNDGWSSANNNRKFSLWLHPTCNDFHWSWMNDAASTTFTSGNITGALPSYKWTHVAVTYQNPTGKIYINGELRQTFTGVSNSASFNYDTNILWNVCATYRYLNDLRIYNHCLSAAEVKKIAKGLVLHYKLDNYSKETTENLFKGTMFRPEDISNWPDNSSTDWTKPVRRYNGSTSIYSIDSGECTVTLNAAANLGICFARLASDINLRSWVKYTISCEAKCSKSGASLAIGLSYYNTSNGWVWRGGTNAVAFKAINTWQTFTLSFYPDSDTQAIDYCFTVVGDANGTNTFTIRHCRMEEGSVATPWYPEDNISTQMTKVIDSSGYNNNAESNGYRIVNLSAGGTRYSKVAQFTTGARITTPMTSNTFLPTDAITINIWCKTPDVSLRFLSCTEGGGWNFEVSGGVLTFPIYIESVGYQICSFTTTLSTMNDNQWHMYTATYNRSQIKVYFDGVLDNTLTVSTGNPIWYLTYTPLCLGTEGRSISDQVAGTFVGALSDLRIYCTPLLDDDIKELYYMGMKIDKGLNIHAYEFKEISNSDIKLYKTGILQNIEFNETTTAAFKKTKKITASLFIEE